jgi:aldehyde:ferredoxin oxidoreductase
MSRGTLRATRSLGIYEDVYNGIDQKYKLAFTNNGFIGHLDPRVSYYYGIPWMMENRDPNRHDYQVLKAEKKFHKLEKVEKITEKLFKIKGIIDHSDGSVAHLNPGKIFFSKWLLIRGMLKDSLTLCDSVFPNYVSPLKERGYCGDLSLESKFYSAVTGDQLKMEELDKLAEGVWNLQRALTIRDWQTRDMRGAEGYRGGAMGDEGGDFKGHDNFSALYYKKPLMYGSKDSSKYSAPLKRDECERAKSMFYREMGWDINGAPTRKTLESFNLKDVADKLDQDGLLGT